MVENTNIEWAHHTFNPWLGCTKVSPGCDNCYAEKLVVGRFKKDVWGPGVDRLRTSEQNWSAPILWNKKAAAAGERHRVFCASLADVFDNDVPQEWREDLFVLIEETPNLDWLLLTKRIGNVAKMMPAPVYGQIHKNVWLGASIVNQEEANRDIPKLLDIPAAIHFLSMEPLLGPVDIITPIARWQDNPISAKHHHELGRLLIDWVIVGGESGPGARPMELAWARNLRDQCTGAYLPFLFKQWGEWIPMSNEELDTCKLSGEWDGSMLRVGKKKAGRELDGRTWDEFPQTQQSK